MGVTIHQKLAQRPELVESTLDNAEKFAKIVRIVAEKVDVKVGIRRISPSVLYIDIGNCETLVFDFKTMKEWAKEAKGEWTYETAFNKEIENIDNEYAWAISFCKTQFSKTLVEHRFVADIIKIVANKCQVAIVTDEGDYYHTGKIKDVEDAIVENGKLINSVGDILKAEGFKDAQIIKQETNIKSTKRV